MAIPAAALLIVVSPIKCTMDITPIKICNVNFIAWAVNRERSKKFAINHIFAIYFKIMVRLYILNI